VKQAKDWDGWSKGGKKELEALDWLASGDARVDPKKLFRPAAMLLQTLCRVYERVNALTDDEDGEDE